MPANAVANVAVDHGVSLRDMPALLTELARTPAANGGDEDVEAAMADDEGGNGQQDATEAGVNSPNPEQNAGPPSAFTCPECGGTLWEINEGELIRFRCHVGHAYTSESMLAEQDEALEAAMWTALRTLKESVNLSRRLEKRARQGGHHISAEAFARRAHEAEQRAEVLRQVLVRNKGADEPPGQPSEPISDVLNRDRSTGKPG
jgi:two-component system chemotaxis response regulator CheB